MKFSMCALFCFLSMAAIASRADSTLTVYTGKYIFPEGNAVPWVEVKYTEGTLVSESPMGSATLQRTEGDVFAIVEYNGTAEFLRDSGGKIMGVKINVMNMVMEGKKEGLQSIKPPYYHPLRPLTLLQ